MDTWKFYDITHREHTVCNPTSDEKIGRLVELLRLPRGARVIDIASGKGELLVRLAEAYGVSGVGVDISPYCIADAERKRDRRPCGRPCEPAGVVARRLRCARHRGAPRAWPDEIARPSWGYHMFHPDH